MTVQELIEALQAHADTAEDGGDMVVFGPDGTPIESLSFDDEGVTLSDEEDGD